MVLRWPLTKDGSPKSSTSLVAQNLEIAQLIYSVNDDNIAQTVGLLFIVCPQCKYVSLNKVARSIRSLPLFSLTKSDSVNESQRNHQLKCCEGRTR